MRAASVQVGHPILDLFLFELRLIRSTYGTGPFIRDILKLGAWGDAVIGISVGGIIDIATDSTNVSIHNHFLLFLCF
jgi:hypothetical protein